MERSNQRLAAAFGVALRRQRERAGLTQEQLAERADVSARFISFLETGKRQPSLSAIEALSSALEMRMTILVDDAENFYQNAAHER
jgi:transcriptional regulator with XRE-family HTH domain